MKRLAFFLIAVLFLTGCAKLAHLQELLTIKAYSDNKDLQEAYVQEQDRNFEKLLAAVKTGEIVKYQTRRSFLKNFGEPVFNRPVEKEGQTYEMWLYRYAQKYFGSEKVYLYFNNKGILQQWDYQRPAPSPDVAAVQEKDAV